jgi:hypothetical protein
VYQPARARDSLGDGVMADRQGEKADREEERADPSE